MSDTTEPGTSPAPKPIPNYASKTATAMVNGRTFAEAEVTYGNPLRTIKVREPDMADQFDLLEIAGEAANNETWMGMALVANAVTSIDGVPMVPTMRKQNLRETIRKLGPVGLAAASKAIGELGGREDADSALDTAKN